MNNYDPVIINGREVLFMDVISNEGLSDRVVIFKDDPHEKKREHFY